MINETKQIKEYHDNGQLAYTDTIAFLDSASINKYQRAALRISHDNKYFIRIGTHAKYNKNGQIVWLFERDEKGQIINYVNTRS